MRPWRATTPRQALAAAALLGALLPAAATAQSPAAVTAQSPAAVTAQSPAAVTAQSPAAVTAQSPAAPTGTWFDGLVPGACFEIALDGPNAIDFGVPPRIVDCAQPHANEVAGSVALGDGAELPPNADQLALEGCAEVVTAFLGRPIESVPALLVPFPVWPDAADWAKGVRAAVCSVAGNGLVGSVRSGTLAAPGETIAAFWQESDTAEIVLLDGGTGEVIRPVTDGSTSELLGPPSWTPDGTGLLFGAQLAEDDTDLYVATADGTGATPLLSAPGRQEGGAFSPDGSRIAYINDAGGGEYDIWVAGLDGSEGTPITDHPGRDRRRAGPRTAAPSCSDG